MHATRELLLLAVIGLFSASWATEDGGKALASKTLEAVRDSMEDDGKNHREKTSILWPEANAVPSDTAEVYLISGYINFVCTRFVPQSDGVKAQRVKLSRTWFYNPKGEGYSMEEFFIPADDFRKAWEAALLLCGAEAQPLQKPEDSLSWTAGYRSRSHEPTWYVHLGSEGQTLFENAVRSMGFRNEIPNFEPFKIRAIYTVFNDLLTDKEGHPFDLQEWGPFLTEVLRNQMPSVAEDSRDYLKKYTTVSLETSLRLLGQSGYEPAQEEIARLKAVALDAQKSGMKWLEPILRECDYVTIKIRFLSSFETAPARELIHSYSRSILPDQDLVLWMRKLFFEKNSDEYLILLSEDLRNTESSETILLESISELRRLHPDLAGELLSALLGHASSEVASNAALAILATDPENIPALQTLNRLASDPAASIPEKAKWFHYFGRERALDHLFSKKSSVPAGFRWDAVRVRRQLAQPGEDGRMVNRLLSALHILEKREVSKKEQIAAYRASLQGKNPAGIETAREELQKLGVKVK